MFDSFYPKIAVANLNIVNRYKKHLFKMISNQYSKKILLHSKEAFLFRKKYTNPF